MPRVSLDGVRIEYREARSGFPLVWAREFGGRMESWEPQVRFFSRRYRVIMYNARGHPRSDVPDDPDAYSQDRAVEDLHQLLGHQRSRAGRIRAATAVQRAYAATDRRPSSSCLRGCMYQ